MHFITTLANKTAEYGVKKMEAKAKKDEMYILREYNEKVSLNPFYQFEQVFSKSRNKVFKFLREDVVELQAYAWFSIYDEGLVLISILALSALLGILLPMTIILTSFLVSRLFLKGDHLNTVNKCTIFTICYLVGFGYLAVQLIPETFALLLKILYYAIIGIVLELASLTKWFKKIINKINEA